MSFIFVGLMMVPDSRTESSPIKFIHKAVITFLSKVVLRLLNQDQKLQFRKLEAISKKFHFRIFYTFFIVISVIIENINVWARK